MRRQVVLLMAFLAVSLGGRVQADPWFSDDFEDGVIDPVHWSHAGAITESDGLLHLDRESPDDWITAVEPVSGDWVIEMDIRLDNIVWNDMFHGIQITDPSGLGISFGYSIYGKLYLAESNGQGQTVYYYGPVGSNQPGRWQHWTIQRQGGFAGVTVDGQIPIPGAFPVADNSTVTLPGLYQDGDGGPHVGFSNSSMDLFSISSDISGVTAREPAVVVSDWGKVKALFR